MTDNRYLIHSPKTVALVGMGPSVMDMANETLTQEYRTSWADEVWTINMAANFVRSDMVIWMDDLSDQNAKFPHLMDALRKWDIPVLTSKSYPNIVPKSYDYPVSEIGNIGLQIWGKPYLNNGVAMAVAYALFKGVKHMRIYGCDFTYPDRNYAESGRACVEAWMTVAAMRDMLIFLPTHTSLCDVHGDMGIYGYKDQPQIVAPDGKIFQYERKAAPTNGAVTATPAYQPEDSSGRNPNGSSVPGIASGPARNGSLESYPKDFDGHAPAAVDRPG